MNKTREQWKGIDAQLCARQNSVAANFYLIKDAQQDIERLHAERDALRLDAERYQLRLETIRVLYPNAPSDIELDAAIDQAMKQ